MGRRGIWSKAEDAVIREKFGVRHTAAIARSMERSTQNVLKLAEQLFPVVRVDDDLGWTDARLERLRRSLGVLPRPMLARVLGVTQGLLEARLASWQAEIRPRPWTRSEDTFLAEVYGTRSDDDLSLVFTRPVADVVSRAKELALAKDKAYRSRAYGRSSTTMPRWTEAELRVLRELYPSTLTADLARRFGRSIKSVTSAAARLYLHKTDTRLSEMGRENVRHRRRK